MSPKDHKLKLSEVLSIRAIQALMDDLNRLFDIGMALIDLDGTVLVASGWQDVCTKFHRQNRETCQNCLESDTILSLGVQPGSYKAYKCKNNLWDISTPIIVGGEHIGNLFVGQFFYEDEAPDYDTFRSQAKAHGFDEKAYLAALDKVPRWNREKLGNLLGFFTRMGTMVSALSYNNVLMARTLQEKDNTEAELRRANSFLDSIVENIPLMVFIKDAEALRFVRFNKAGEKLLGYPREALIGKNDYDFFPLDQARFFIEKDRSVLNNGQLLDITEEPLETSDKGTRLLHTLKVPVLDSQGNPEYLLGISEDITERRQAEKALAESEARYKALAAENAALLEQSRLDAESKMMLLHEVNHRVKNNLMSIIGLLYAQKRFISDDIRSEFTLVMKDLAGRIETLATAHNMLSAVKWRPIPITRLFAEIFHTCATMVPIQKKFSYSYSGHDANIPPGSINSLSLVLFELATNSIKHGLKHQDEISITFQGQWNDSVFSMCYRDSGPGFPTAVTDHGQGNLGLYLVRSLAAHDLRAAVRFYNDGGAVVEIVCQGDTCVHPVTNSQEDAHA